MRITLPSCNLNHSNLEQNRVASIGEIVFRLLKRKAQAILNVLPSILGDAGGKIAAEKANEIVREVTIK